VRRKVAAPTIVTHTRPKTGLVVFIEQIRSDKTTKQVAGHSRIVFHNPTISFSKDAK
jgi:hypothetical protein